MIHRGVARLVSLFLIALLLYGSLTPNASEPSFIFYDKFMHFTAYLVICFWHCRMFPGRRFSVLLACISLGACIEVLQAYLGYRDASLMDELANSLGCGLGYLLARGLKIRLFQDDPAYS